MAPVPWAGGTSGADPACSLAVVDGGCLAAGALVSILDPVRGLAAVHTGELRAPTKTAMPRLWDLVAASLEAVLPCDAAAGPGAAVGTWATQRVCGGCVSPSSKGGYNKIKGR